MVPAAALPAYPADFPRFVQRTIWRADAFDTCNGNMTSGAEPCQNALYLAVQEA